jgi:DNA adenine methylase
MPLTSLTRPVLRYFGGKWRLAPWLVSLFPPHRVYVEPYGGGASVLLRKPRSRVEVYSELDGRVVNVFRVLRNPRTAGRLKRALELTPFARAEFELAHEDCPECPVEDARRTIIRAFMGFGADSVCNPDRSTGFRAKSNGSNWTPALEKVCDEEGI